MLILQSARDELLKPLQTVTGIVERRHTMPILANVLIENSSNQIRFLGTDLEIQITTQGPSVDAPEFRLTVNAKKLQDILRTLPESAPVSLDMNENQLTLKAGKSRFNLQTLKADDFPTMNIGEDVKICFTLSQDNLRLMLSQVQYAMAVQDIRFYLNGLLMQTEGNQLCLVATDGHRLAYSRTLIDADLPSSEVIIPRKTVLELYKLLDFPKEPVTVEILGNQVRFRCNQTTVVSKVVEGKFPDYNRVIPQDNDKIFLISRQDLLGALERVSILSSEKIRGVSLNIKPGLLAISCRNSEQEVAQDELEIAYQGEELEISFNIGYLIDVLRNTNDHDIQMAFGNAQRSLLITLPENNDFKYIVMPMRI